MCQQQQQPMKRILKGCSAAQIWSLLAATATAHMINNLMDVDVGMWMCVCEYGFWTVWLGSVVSLDLQVLCDQRARVTAGKQRICLPLDLHWHLQGTHTHSPTHTHTHTVLHISSIHHTPSSRLSCAAHVANGNEIQNENDRKFVTHRRRRRRRVPSRDP